jgi:hypothetical protein
VVVKKDLDRPISGAVLINPFQAFDEFQASAAVCDRGMEVTVVEVKTSQKADCPEALVLVVSCP